MKGPDALTRTLGGGSAEAVAHARAVGEQWVERFLIPLLRERLRGGKRRLTCLQIEPADTTLHYGEAERLRREGHECDVLLCPIEPSGPEQMLDPTKLPVESNHYDLIMTGRFGKMVLERERRVRVARELARVCRSNGAMLMSIGNRLCPFDLSANAAVVHGLGNRTLLTLREIEELFVAQAGFTAVHPLGITGFFSWSRAQGSSRLLARALEAYWRRLAVPSRRWLYASPLNPFLVLWIER